MPTPDTPADIALDTEVATPRHEHSYIHNKTKDDYLKRLRRIEGQARGLQRMVEDEQYCIDILTQISATTKALQAVALGLLDEHLNHCVLEAAQHGGPEADHKMQEASEAIRRLVRS
jgi:DNA-binding FrmR family transcriptional regulator